MSKAIPTTSHANLTVVSDVIDSSCKGSNLNLDALMRARSCVVSEATHADAERPTFTIQLEGKPLPGALIDVIATLENPGEHPLWVEIEQQDVALGQDPIHPKIVWLPLGQDVLELPFGTINCSEMIGVSGGAPPARFVQLLITPHGRATLHESVQAIGYRRKAQTSTGCPKLVPLPTGSYQIRAGLRLSGDRSLDGTATFDLGR